MSRMQLFVEPRPQGRFAVEHARAQRASAVTENQGEAIALARKLNPDHPPIVARVRHTAKGKPGQWRKAGS